MSQCQSFGSNYRCGSQPRKISIGVLVDSISKGGSKDIGDTGMLIEKNTSPNKGNCTKNHDGHTSLLGTVPQKDAPPCWFSTTCYNPKPSSSVAIHDAEPTSNSFATNIMQSRLEDLEKASAVNSAKFSAGKTGLESDECRQKFSSKTTDFMDAGKPDNEKHAKTTAFSKEPGVRQTNVKVQDEEREANTAGNKTLRMKLWKILGNISPNKHSPNPQSVNSHPDEDVHWKHSPVEDENQNSDKIESDSEKHAFGRPMTCSLTRKKTSTKNQGNKIEAQKPTCHRKVFLRKRMLSFKEDWSGRFYDNSNDGSLTCKRNKTGKQSSVLETHGHKHEIAEKQPERKSGSIPVVEKSMVHRSKLVSANCAYDQRYGVFEEPDIGRKQNYSIEEQKDVERMVDVEIPTSKDQQANSLLKNRGPCVQDPLTPNLETISPDCSRERKGGMLHGHSPDKNIFITKGIRSFKSLLSSKSAEGKANVQLELSDGRCEFNDSLDIKPSIIMEDNSESQMSKSSTNLMDDANLEAASDIRDGAELEQLSPEGSMGHMFPHGTDTYHGKEKDVEMTECIPESKSFKGSQDSSELQIYLEQNNENSLASAVALINVALRHIKMKLRSVTNKRSAEILCAAAEEILLLFQNAEYQIQTDMGKLTNFSQSKRKQLENRFKEQQEQLLGIYRRFKDEVGRHLKDYNDIIEDVEENATELKRTMGRQRAAHQKLISQVEQEVKVELEDAESRIMAIQELAKQKMLQLKLVVAESVKHDAFR